jgi:hypothetical protein
MRNMTLAILAATTALVASPANAVQIADGTVSLSILVPPTVTLGGATASYASNSAATFQTAADGGFAGVAGAGFGSFNGTINFATSEGATRSVDLPNLFTFSNATTNFSFSATSVRTMSYDVMTGSTAIALYLLGTTVGTGLDATPTSLTLSFNSTGGSAYSASATLAVPPSPIGDVPEPASWAMMVGGFGLMGFGLRSQRRRRVSYSIG